MSLPILFLFYNRKILYFFNPEYFFISYYIFLIHNIFSFQNMITGRHNGAYRLIMKVISKGSQAGCLVHLDASSTDCLGPAEPPNS